MTQDDQQPDEDSPARSSHTVDLLVRRDHDGWSAGLADCDGVAARAALAALAAFEPGPVSLSVVLADDATVRRLNDAHRGKDKPTNVLSFPAAVSEPDGPEALGDVILAWETVAAEAADQDKTLADHLSHLVVHGVLHLMGLDHQDPDEAEEMEALERRVLAGLGVADPYADAGVAAGGRAA